MADEDVTVKMGADISDLSDGVDRAKEEINSLSEGLDSFRETAQSIGEALGVAFSLESVKEFAVNMAELGEKTIRLSTVLGSTTESIGFLDTLAKTTGTDVERMALSFERLSLNMQKSTRDGTNPQAQALRLLGINAKDFIALPFEGKLNALADATSKFNPSLNLTNALMEVGGRGIQSLIPGLEQGSEKFKELALAAQLAGVNLSKEAAAAMDETNTKMKILGQAVQGLGIELFLRFRDAIDSNVTELTRFIETLNEFVQNPLARLKIGLETDRQFLDKLAEGFANTLVAAERLWNTEQADADEAAINLAKNQALMSASLKRLAADMDYVAGRADDMENRIAAGFSKVTSTPFAPGGPGALEKAKQNMGAIDFSKTGSPDTTAEKVATIGIETEISQLQDALKRKQTILEAELKLHMINDQQMAQSSHDAIDDEYNDEKDLLTKELSLWNSSSVEYARVKEKLVKLDEKYAQESLKINVKLAEDTAKEWDKVTSTITSAFNSQISGLLKGTTTFSQAMQNVFLDLTAKVIEAFEKWAITAIMNDAKAVFGGVFAFLSPIMGPAAAGPAAAAMATVEGFASGGAATGIWDLPQDSNWNLHAGEMVVPANFAEGIRSAASGGGGGSNITLNIQAIDPQSGLQWVKNNASMIAKQLNKQMAINPSARPSY